MSALRACTIKGCPWRGANPADCPMHTSGDAWERQSKLKLDHLPHGVLKNRRTHE